MSILLLNLRDVPDDEADDVRALLAANAIEFFETRPSRWGVSAGTIWIRDDAAASGALRLMADYQARRREHARSERAAAHRDGRAMTLWSNLREQPLRVALALVSIAFVLALLALPIFLLAR